jgi:hypothetical protein
MLARGCTINGANTILIDVNQDALEKIKTKLKGLALTFGWSSLKIEL